MNVCLGMSPLFANCYSGQFRSISPPLSNMGEKALIALLQKDDQA